MTRTNGYLDLSKKSVALLTVVLCMLMGSTASIAAPAIDPALATQLQNLANPSTINGGSKPRIINSPTPAAATTSIQNTAQSAGGITPQALIQPPASLNSFQTFLAHGDVAATSTTLEIFGQNLFAQQPTTFAPVDSVPVPADYVVGPGDEIVLRAWGQVDINYRASVDRRGNFYIPNVGSTPVAGLKYSALPAYLRTVIGRVYKDFDLDVGLEQLRSIPVFVLGQVKQPGHYTISSLSTLVNALFAAGGPTPQGSMRTIQLKRNGKVVTEFDMYNLLLAGDKSQDTNLLPGDVVFVPPVGSLAAVAGDVNNPAIYEIKDSTTLGQLLGLAGGLATTAYGQKVSVERIINRDKRLVEEFSLDQAGLGHPIQNGDLVRVFSVQPRFENAVTLKGNVAWPGRYPWREGMRIRDLLPSKDALMERAYWRRQNNPTVLLSSRPQEPNWEYAVIERVQQPELVINLVPFNLRRAIIEDSEADNLLLQPGDTVTVFSKQDIQVPEAKRTRFVRIEGEVARPGVYQALPGDTLLTIIERAGGFTRDASPFAASLTRESVRQEQQLRLQESLDKLEQQINQNAAEASAKALTPETSVAAATLASAQRELLARLRLVKTQGRIVLGVPDDAQNISALPSLPLEDGDRFFIPSRATLVNVMGEVYNQNAFIYRPGTRIGDYLNQAGGPTAQADEDSIYVIRADGSVISAQQQEWFSSLKNRRILPGDTLVIPPQVEKVAWLRDLKDITQIILQIATTALIAVRL